MTIYGFTQLSRHNSYACLFAAIFVFTQDTAARGYVQPHVDQQLFTSVIVDFSSDDPPKISSLVPLYHIEVSEYSQRQSDDQEGVKAPESSDASHRDDNADSSSRYPQQHRKTQQEGGGDEGTPSSPAHPKHGPHDTIWRRVKAYFAEIFQTR
ncbi:MAG: hypothetical protein CMF52_08630 [Legionellales bacterium]|nr:hypothetical protein [Legionellales bacterium]